MSLWHCKEHGLVGPEACCPSASRASLGEISATVPSRPARDGETLSDEQLTAIGYRAGIRLSDSVDELERAAAQDTLNAVKIARAIRDEVARLRARSEESE